MYIRGRSKKNEGIQVRLNKSFETVVPGKATVVGMSSMSAKELLTYSHNGGNATIILCVPKKNGKLLKNATEFENGVVTDPYVRKRIYCLYDEDEWSDENKITFSSIYYYPTKAILFAFNIDSMKIKINNSYSESLYLDQTTPQALFVNPGEILDIFKNIDDYNIEQQSKR